MLMQTRGWVNSHPHTITNSTFDWFLFSWNSLCLIYHISNNFCPTWPIYVLYIYIYISDFPDSYMLLPSNYYLPIYFKFWPWIQTQCLYVWLYLTLNYMWHFLYILNSGTPFLSKLLGSQSVWVLLFHRSVSLCGLTPEPKRVTLHPRAWSPF